MLGQAGILETREGFGGGVRLQKAVHQVTLLDIFEAIEEGKPLFKTNLHINVKDPRPQRLLEGIQKTLHASEESMRQNLGKTTLKDILKLGDTR